ncbi:MAG: GNAT family N-acetyltransferase [Ktedonobacteraceae bacterium]|nr:GNAT family N-acetyltransferase [Ktedonobacteraceae bacterium]
MPTIRRASDADFDAIWEIFHQVAQGGDTIASPPETTREEAYQAWMRTPTATYVALADAEIVGTYYLKPNQEGLGSHVCNAGYLVKSQARRQGIGRAMGLHSLQEARELGFYAMQFNLVVSTNQTAVRLWQDLGFSIVGTLPKAFNHKRLGFVDALVMYQLLNSPT